MNPEGSQKKVDRAELVQFGTYLNGLHGHPSCDCDLEVAQDQMQSVPLDALIKAYQDFFDGKRPTFRCRVTTVDAGKIKSVTKSYNQ
jgi:hypothetical protein